MPERIPANSESFQKAHPDAYANFFVGNDLVVGACFSFGWTPPGTGDASKYAMVKSHLPLRLYVGVTKSAGSEVTLGGFFAPKSPSGNFFETPLAKVIGDGPVKEIRAYLAKAKLAAGVKVNVLSESPRGHGLGIAGTFSACLASALRLLSGEISAPQVADLAAFRASPAYAPTAELGFAFEMSIKPDGSSGRNVTRAFFPHEAPAVHLVSGDAPRQRIDVAIHELAGTPARPMPLDYAIVFTGLATDTNEVLSQKRLDLTDLGALSETAKKILRGAGKGASAFFLSKLTDPEKTKAAFTDAIAGQNLRTVELLLAMGARGNDPALASAFVRHAEEYRSLCDLTERSSGFADQLESAFTALRKNPEDEIGLYPLYSGKLGGGYGVVMKKGLGRKTFEEALASILERYPDAYAEYQSWTDQAPCRGVTVEQFASQGIASPLAPADAAKFWDNRGRSYVGNYSEILENEKDCLLLDQVRMKVVFGGEKTSSKDFPSQSTVVEVLSRLIAQPGKDVPNSALPSSSYSKDKGLLIAKVLNPLAAFAKKNLGEGLTVRCQGSAGNFTVSLAKTPIRIGVVSK